MTATPVPSAPLSVMCESDSVAAYQVPGQAGCVHPGERSWSCRDRRGLTASSMAGFLNQRAVVLCEPYVSHSGGETAPVGNPLFLA